MKKETIKTPETDEEKYEAQRESVVATRIEELESALMKIADANSNWAMNMDDKTAEAIQRLIVQAQTA